MGIKDGRLINGKPVLDETPMEQPLGYRKPPTLQDQIRRFTQLELQRIAGAGEESPEEMEDLEVTDDDEIPTPYEMVYDESLDREITRAEFAMMETARREFDNRWLDARKRASAKAKPPRVKKKFKQKTKKPRDYDRF